MLEVRWHGRGGQGAFTASKILGAAVILDGKYALSFPSFGPERRGAPIQTFTKIGDSPITDRSVIHKADYIVYLDETLYSENVKNDLKVGGKIYLNSRNPEKYDEDPDVTAIDADKISQKVIGRAVSNTVMLSALVLGEKITGPEQVKSVLKNFLTEKVAIKNEKIVDEIGEFYE